MKIGILLGPNARGGMERQAHLLAHGLIRRGIQTRIIFNSRPSRQKVGFDWEAVPHQYLWRYNPVKEISRLYLAHLLRRHQVDLLHVFFWANMEFATGAMKWARTVKFVGSQRDTDFVTYSDIKERLEKACLFYDHITCNTKTTRDLMNSSGTCAQDKIKVIYNGVVIPEYGRDNNGNPDGPRTVLFPNRLFKYKNPLLFIEACAEVQQRLGNLKIIVCGYGDLEDEMKARTHELGIGERCQFFNSLLSDEIPYQEADLVVNCSSSLEGMSNSLMEALANGVPVVSTKVGGNPELLTDCNFGRLVPIDDKVALVNAMCEMLSIDHQKREHYRQQARAYMANFFSVDRFVDEHVAYYSQILSRPCA